MKTLCFLRGFVVLVRTVSIYFSDHSLCSYHKPKETNMNIAENVQSFICALVELLTIAALYELSAMR